MPDSQPHEVLVLGGGIIGLAVAWRARARGLSVTVLERGEAGRATSHVAAGMLAPVSEVEFGAAGARLLDLGLESAAMWPAFAAELEAVSGEPVALTATGTLLVARDGDEARELERQLDFRRSLGLPVERLRASEARDREPALAPTLRMAIDVPDDHSLDPRQALDALRAACVAAGVGLREHTAVASVKCDAAERVTGVRLEDGERIDCDRLVVAAGPWSGALPGLPDHARVPVRPVKGQILRLRDPAGPGLLRRAVRYDGGYLLPRGDGRYVLGATVEERGFELCPTAGGVEELLSEARELVPGVSEMQIEELSVGLRPSTPDNAPLIGAGAIDGLLWATGHHRNGILLAPLTAALMADVLAGTEAAPAAEQMLGACDPGRFAAGRPHESVRPTAGTGR
ncbi:MAG TPA: glycine oxidase ThiO [Solirubrobacteraceae bacterium]